MRLLSWKDFTNFTYRTAKNMLWEKGGQEETRVKVENMRQLIQHGGPPSLPWKVTTNSIPWCLRDVYQHWSQPETMLKIQVLGSHPKVPDPAVWDRIWAYAFLTHYPMGRCCFTGTPPGTPQSRRPASHSTWQRPLTHCVATNELFELSL